MDAITSHAEYLAASDHLRSLKGAERAELSAAITAWKTEDAKRRAATAHSQADELIRLGQAHGDAELVRAGRSNPYGLTTRANRKRGY